MLKHILAFKGKILSYKEHPGLKSSEKEQVDETIIDWEPDINLTYYYTYLELSDAVVYAVQDNYFQAPFADSLKKLMMVDLEKATSGDSISISLQKNVK